MPEEQLIYKVCDRNRWEEAVARGVFEGAEIDLADGFIHFSAKHQVVETVTKHFAGKENLVLVAVPANKLGDALKWEPSRGGDLFPHLYDPLPTSLAVSVEDLPIGSDGKHRFPSSL